jgi:hypothetical protein
MPRLHAWFWFCLSPLTCATASAASLRVEGTQIVLTDDRGQELRGAGIEGVELDLSDLGTLRVQRNAIDPGARFSAETWLLDAELRPPGATAFANACATRAGDDARMVIYQGYLDPDLHYVDDHTRFSLSCVGGVEAKCLRWGYLPWRRAPAADVPLAPYFESCVRLARADYCGDGRASTREGTAVDIHDEVGVLQRTPNLHEFAFEAGWTPRGAVCVHHTRIPEILALDALPQRCARLADAPRGEDCTEAVARASGALLMVRSVVREAER